LNVIFTIFQKKLCGKVKYACYTNLTIWIIVFQFHLRAICNLVFCSISNLLLLNDFLKNEKQVCFFWNFLPRLSTQFININFFKFKVSSAKFFHKWWSKSFEIVRQCHKKTVFSTLNVDIFQSVQSNLMKFLPHDLRQVKYKILWLDS